MKHVNPMWLSLFLLLSSASCEMPRTVTLTVVSDDGAPIEGADVLVGFVGYKNDSDQKGLTNKSGVFVTQGIADLNIMTRVAKDGFYTTEIRTLLKSKDHDLTLTLREKKNPIPLYAKKIATVLPEIGGAFGFDFKIGDWVSPHGEGKDADVMFQATEMQDEEGELGGKIEIVFPNEGEGIVFVEEGYYPRSELVMPHLAPEGGYRDEYSRIEMGYQNENKERNGSFFCARARKPCQMALNNITIPKFMKDFSF